MGSSEEEKLVQIVTDFIESEGSPITTSPKTTKTHHTFSSLQDVLMRVTNAESLILEKIIIYLKDMEFTEEPNNLNKFIVMRLITEGFEASLCRTSWLATFGRPSGDYEYVDVMMKDMGNGGEAVRLIVDLDFRSQFELARPTSTYMDLLTSLPSIFVGTEEKLMSVISLLCSAAKHSLRERGLHIPPWRKAGYMQSKWLSDNCKKISFTNT